MKNLNHYVAIYKDQLNKGDILIAYNELVKFMMKLRVGFMKRLAGQYAFSGMLHGYMDYTYFYYTNELLKNKRLKLGLVLNHLEMRFEIWLIGNTTSVQKAYWELLKDSKWNKGRKEMPQYSVLIAEIEKDPDFNDLDRLEEKIEKQLTKTSREIIAAVKPPK